LKYTLESHDLRNDDIRLVGQDGEQHFSGTLSVVEG
jgi:hypothetical protein